MFHLIGLLLKQSRWINLLLMQLAVIDASTPKEYLDEKMVRKENSVKLITVINYCY